MPDEVIILDSDEEDAKGSLPIETHTRSGPPRRLFGMLFDFIDSGLLLFNSLTL